MLKPLLCVLLLLAGGLARGSHHVARAASTPPSVLNAVTDGGMVGDDATDNTAAWIALAARIGDGTILTVPPGTYYMARYKGDGLSPAAADVQIVGHKGFTLEATGAIFRMNGAFQRDGVKEAFCPLAFVNDTGFRVRGLEMNGSVDQMTRTPANRAPGFSGHGFRTAGCTSYSFIECSAHHFSADGFYLGGGVNATPGGTSSYVVADRDAHLLRCRAWANSRQGCSIIQAQGVEIAGCRLNDTGKTNTAGTAVGPYGHDDPSAGLDIEPNVYAYAAFRPWSASRPVLAGDLFVPSTDNTRLYKATTAGTTASIEPSWPTTTGATVSDGTAVWTDQGHLADVATAEVHTTDTEIAGNLGTASITNTDLQTVPRDGWATGAGLDAFTSERAFTVQFDPAPSPQAIDFYLPASTQFYGEITATVTGAYNAANLTGTLSKRFGLGLSPTGSVFSNVEQTDAVLGATATTLALLKPSWDAVTLRWRFTLVSRNAFASSANRVTVAFRCVGGDSFAVGAFRRLTRGQVYLTTDPGMAVQSAGPSSLTTTQRDALVSPPEGQAVWNLTTHKLNVWNGSAWREVSDAPG